MGSKPRAKRLLFWTGAILLLLLLAGGIAGYRYLFAKTNFDPDAVAAAETRMWQAYYGKSQFELGRNLVEMLHGQFGAPRAEAALIGEKLAKAAMKFASARGDYDRIVLPGLIDAYTDIRAVSGLGFDPEEAARAELAWWVQRRIPGEDDPETVGLLIGDLYAILYGADNPAFAEAGILRAEAGALRDAGGANADWPRVEELLRQSYRRLAEAL